jgi:hypothetical protein
MRQKRLIAQNAGISGFFQNGTANAEENLR